MHSISSKTIKIITLECEKIDPHYDGYHSDLFELIADIASLELSHAKERGQINLKITKLIEASVKNLLERRNEEDAE